MQVFTHISNIEHIQHDSDFNASLDEVLENYYLRQPPYAEQTQGRSITTCGDQQVVMSIKKFNMVIEWLEHTLSCYFQQHGVQHFEYRLLRSWCNRIFLGVSGRVHNHWCNIPNTLSVVLYYQIPPRSAKYVVIDHPERRDRYSDYHLDYLTFFETRPGMAICHDSKIWHDVTEHGNVLPRTVFVFDVEYQLS